jgi:hypothetical protein
MRSSSGDAHQGDVDVITVNERRTPDHPASQDVSDSHAGGSEATGEMGGAAAGGSADVEVHGSGGVMDRLELRWSDDDAWENVTLPPVRCCVHLRTRHVAPRAAHRGHVRRRHLALHAAPYSS